MVRSNSARIRSVMSGRAPRARNPGARSRLALGQAHLGDVDEGGEQRPVAVGGAQGVVVTHGRQPGAEAEPSRDVGPGLSPGEDPGDRPQVGEVAAARGTAAAHRT